MAHSRMFIPTGPVECSPSAVLPKLGDVEFVLLRASGKLREPIAELSAAILAKAKNFA